MNLADTVSAEREENLVSFLSEGSAHLDPVTIANAKHR